MSMTRNEFYDRAFGLTALDHGFISMRQLTYLVDIHCKCRTDIVFFFDRDGSKLMKYGDPPVKVKPAIRMKELLLINNYITEEQAKTIQQELESFQQELESLE